MSNQLSPKAETLRQEIKKLVAQSVLLKEDQDQDQGQQPAVFTENAHGDKSYEGRLFDDKVSKLVNEMGLRVWESCQIPKLFLRTANWK